MDLVMVHRGGRWSVQKPSPPDPTKTVPAATVGRSQDLSKKKPTMSKNKISSAIKNKKLSTSFTCFPELVVELRLAVLEAALVDDQPIVNFKSYGVDSTVLRTSKWFHEEGLKIYYTKNIFHFTDIRILLDRLDADLLKDPRPIVSPQRFIQHLSMELLLSESFETNKPSPRQMLRAAKEGYYPLPKPSHWTNNSASASESPANGPVNMIRITSSHMQQLMTPFIRVFDGKQGVIETPIKTLKVHLTGATCYLQLTDFINPLRGRHTGEDSLAIQISALVVSIVGLRQLHISGMEDKVVCERITEAMCRFIAPKGQEGKETEIDEKHLEKVWASLANRAPTI